MEDQQKTGAVEETADGDVRASGGTETAGRASTASPPPEATDPADETYRGRLERVGVDLGRPWRELFGTNLGTRFCNKLDEKGIETVGGVVDLLDDRTLTDLEYIGTGTRERVVEEVEALWEKGPEVYRFGEGGRPRSLPELVERALDMLDERAATVARRRFFEQETLTRIGESLGVSYERIRQIKEALLEELRPIFHEPASELTGKLLERLDRSAGLLYLPCIDAYFDEPPRAGWVVLACRLAGAEEVRIWRGAFLTNLSDERRAELFDELEAYLREQVRLEVGLEDIHAWADDRGAELDDQTARRLADIVLEVDLSDGPVYAPWRYNRDAVAEAVRRVGGPAATDEVREEYETIREEFPSLPDVTDKDRRGYMHQHDEVYLYEHGVYIHLENLPLSREQLREAADWAVDRLEGEPDAVSVDLLVAEMDRESIAPPGLTPHLLKSALTDRPDVSTFKNTRLVAHEESFEHEDVTMLDRIEAVLREADGPLSARQVTDATHEYAYARTSIGAGLRKADFAVRWGPDGYIHRDRVDLDDEQAARLLDAIWQQLPDDGTPRSAPLLLEALDPGDRALVIDCHDSARPVWALAGNDDRFEAGSGLLLARRDDDDTSLIRRCILDALEAIGPATPRETYRHLERQHGYTGRYNTIIGMICTLRDEGLAERDEEGWHKTSERGK